MQLKERGCVSVISSDPSCKDDNVRFTTVPLTALSDLKREILHFFRFFDQITVSRVTFYIGHRYLIMEGHAKHSKFRNTSIVCFVSLFNISKISTTSGCKD